MAGLPADQVELLRSLPAWEARLAVADTIPREERASREYRFDPDRFRGLAVPTMFLQGGGSPAPFKAAAEAVREALPDCRVVVMPGSACRDGYRYRAVHGRDAELSGGRLERAVYSELSAQGKRREEAAALRTFRVTPRLPTGG